MMENESVVLLLDVDHTSLENDRILSDLKICLLDSFGKKRRIQPIRKKKQ